MNNKTDLLWTGGWDSTFRLLQLLFIEKKIVKPHYIVRPQACTGKEIDTIHDIRRKISRQYPEQRELLLPIAYIGDGEIKENRKITSEYKKIAGSKRLSVQYEILARYCEQIGVFSMELSVLDRDKYNYFKSHASFFKYFDLPLLGLDKSEMAKIAKENEWTEIMKMTWFCRRPINGRPCGLCGPCTDAVIGGVGWRLPIRARVIANIQLPIRKWWRNNYQKQDKGILKYVPKLMKDRF